MSLGWLFCDTCKVYKKWHELVPVPKDYTFPLDCGHDSTVKNNKRTFETDDLFYEYVHAGYLNINDLDICEQKEHPDCRKNKMNTKPNGPELDRRCEYLDGYTAAANTHSSPNATIVKKHTEELKSNPMVFHPSHYNVNGVEVYDVIRAFGLSYELGNVLKYTCRAYRKGTPVQDLEKAMFYLGLEIDRLKQAIKEDISWKPYEDK